MVNELVRIRKQLKSDRETACQCRSGGGSTTEATALVVYPVRACDGDVVVAAGRVRVRELTGGQTVTVYQLLDDATGFDVGTDAYEWHENSADARRVLEEAWELPEQMPATEPIPLVVIEAKAAEYLQARRLRNLDRSALTITKTGQVLGDEGPGDVVARAADQSTVEVTRNNRQVYAPGGRPWAAGNETTTSPVYRYQKGLRAFGLPERGASCNPAVPASR